MTQHDFRIYYDSLQEGLWFQGLHPKFAQAQMFPITGSIETNSKLTKVLAYDRPDIILCDGLNPILVIERTVEVPTGHNVGQRFGRIVAAAEAQVPVVYFGPYMARKHGGATAGPRYMNLRLFSAFDALARINNAAVTSINWPVDNRCELLRNADKDKRMKEYVSLFLNAYSTEGLPNISKQIMGSTFHQEQLKEREQFILDHVRSPQGYDGPPPSVQLLSRKDFCSQTKVKEADVSHFEEIVLYMIGMNYIRSDPYTGTGMLYLYLYVLGEPKKKRGLILHFPGITVHMWEQVSALNRRKDIRLYRLIANGIIFKDGFRTKANLEESPTLNMGN